MYLRKNAFAFLCVIFILCYSRFSYSVEFSNLRVLSNLNEPLLAQAKLNLDEYEDISSIEVTHANKKEYNQVAQEKSLDDQNIQFIIHKKDNKAFLFVLSKNPLSKPVTDIAIKIANNNVSSFSSDSIFIKPNTICLLPKVSFVKYKHKAKLYLKNIDSNLEALKKINLAKSNNNKNIKKPNILQIAGTNQIYYNFPNYYSQIKIGNDNVYGSKEIVDLNKHSKFKKLASISIPSSMRIEKSIEIIKNQSVLKNFPLANNINKDNSIIHSNANISNSDKYLGDSDNNISGNSSNSSNSSNDNNLIVKTSQAINKVDNVKNQEGNTCELENKNKKESKDKEESIGKIDSNKVNVNKIITNTKVSTNVSNLSHKNKALNEPVKKDPKTEYTTTVLTENFKDLSIPSFKAIELPSRKTLSKSKKINLVNSKNSKSIDSKENVDSTKSLNNNNKINNLSENSKNKNITNSFFISFVDFMNVVKSKFIVFKNGFENLLINNSFVKNIDKLKNTQIIGIGVLIFVSVFCLRKKLRKKRKTLARILSDKALKKHHEIVSNIYGSKKDNENEFLTKNKNDENILASRAFNIIGDKFLANENNDKSKGKCKEGQKLSKGDVNDYYKETNQYKNVKNRVNNYYENNLTKANEGRAVSKSEKINYANEKSINSSYRFVDEKWRKETATKIKIEEKTKYLKTLTDEIEAKTKLLKEEKNKITEKENEKSKEKEQAKDISIMKKEVKEINETLINLQSKGNTQKNINSILSDKIINDNINEAKNIKTIDINNKDIVEKNLDKKVMQSKEDKMIAQEQTSFKNELILEEQSDNLALSLQLHQIQKKFSKKKLKKAKREDKMQTLENFKEKYVSHSLVVLDKVKEAENNASILKLDLAENYLKIGNHDMAKDLLEQVILVSEGEIKNKAENLLKKVLK